MCDDLERYLRKKVTSLNRMSHLLRYSEPSNPDHRSNPTVLGWLVRREFAQARLRSPGFSLWSNHREFALEREALYWGYGSAGVAARFQRVPFDALERWSRLTGAPIDADGLDEFATHWNWRRTHPRRPICGRFGAIVDREQNAATDTGVQCVRVCREVYVGWCDDYAKSALFAPPSLDSYAAQVVECCVLSARRARCPAVSSA